jgi:DNA-binding LacI/PurR family transcriptional regulator
VPTRKRGVSIRQVAQEVGLAVDYVRNVLREMPGLSVTRELADKIFKTARRMGYDFRKLKIGKRMQSRKETLDEVLEKIAENPGWNRSEIVKYLKESRALVDRVHRRVFREEFGEGD